MQSFEDIFNKNKLQNEYLKNSEARNNALFKRLIESEKLKKFIQESPVTVTTSMIKDELLIVKMFVDQKTECVRGEDGQCLSHKNGYVYNLEVRDNKINMYITPCDIKIENDKYKEKEKLIESFHISKDIETATFDDLYVDKGSNREKVIYEAIETAGKIVTKEGYKGLYIHGQFGVGKSFFLGCIANELKEKSMASMIIYVPELLQDLKAGFKDGTTDNKLNALKQADVLMLDDLGAEDITSWSRDDVLTPILQSRMAEKRPTFISSNYSIDDLVELYGTSKSGVTEKIKSTRMVERIRSLTNEIELTGPNYRH